MSNPTGPRAASGATPGWRRLGRSLLAWALANPLGWLAVVIVTSVHNALRPDPNLAMASGLAMGGMFVIGCVFSYPLTLLIGLPVQAWLQRRGRVSLTSNLLAAVLIGGPVALAVAFGNASGMDPLPKRLDTALTTGTYALLFLLFGGILFWLIRRPDRDPD